MAASVLVGALTAAAMAFDDWRLNPGDIFHDALGTNWWIVLQTWWSWFPGIAVGCAVPLLPVFVCCGAGYCRPPTSSRCPSMSAGLSNTR